MKEELTKDTVPEESPADAEPTKIEEPVVAEVQSTDQAQEEKDTPKDPEETLKEPVTDSKPGSDSSDMDVDDLLNDSSDDSAK